jgi:hypothetical protein
MKSIDYQNGKAKCPCGGQIMYDGSYTQKMPIGLGFLPGSTSFQIDFVLVKGWYGQCLKCNEEIRCVASRRQVVKYPAKINRQLKQRALENDRLLTKL